MRVLLVLSVPLRKRRKSDTLFAINTKSLTMKCFTSMNNLFKDRKRRTETLYLITEIWRLILRDFSAYIAYDVRPVPFDFNVLQLDG